jgi:hypothetical protein
MTMRGRPGPHHDLGVGPSNFSLRGKGDAGTCEAAGSKKPEASLMTPTHLKHVKTRSFPREYVEGFSSRERRRYLQIVCRSRTA